MKRITRLFATALLCCSVSGAYALDVFVSAKGDDKADGRSIGTPVKTLHRIADVIQTDLGLTGYTLADGERINVYVTGMLNIMDEPMSNTENPDWIDADNNTNTGYITFKGNAPAGFYFADINNWDRVDFYGASPMEPMEMPNAGDGQKYNLLPVDGFDAQLQSRIFAINGGMHTFKNLKFTGGSDLAGDGGNAMWIRNSDVTFQNCYFTLNFPPQDAAGNLDETDGHRTSGDGGVVAFLSGGNATDEPNAITGKPYRTETYIDCVFDNNMNKKGGAICHRGGGLYIKGCLFMNHNDGTKVQNSSGEANNYANCLALENGYMPVMDVVIENTLFKDNKSWGDPDGGVISAKDLNKNEGASVDITLKNCNFVGNVAGDRGGKGGALFFKGDGGSTATSGKVAIKILGCQFIDNIVRYDGGAIILRGTNLPGNEFTIANSTFYNNSTLGNANEHGAAIRFDNNDATMANWTVNLYNNLIEKNYASGDGTPKLGGITFPPGSTAPSKWNTKNNMISNVNSTDGTINVESFFDATNDINYYPQGSDYTAEGNEDYTNYPGLDIVDDANYKLDPTARPQVSGFKNFFFVYPLLPDAKARTFGDAQYLDTYGLTADVIGYDYVTEGTACPVGAVQALGDADLDDGLYSEGTLMLVYDTWPYPQSTFKPVYNGYGTGGVGIAIQEAAQDATFVIDGSVSLVNGEAAQIDVIGLSGAVVASGVGSVSIENLPQGLYIAKAQVGGNVYVQKFVK